MPRKPDHNAPAALPLKAAAIPFAWLIAAIATVWAGFLPNPYLEHVRLMPPPHPYPTETVVRIVIFMAVQAALLMAILRPARYRHAWGRALAALAVSLGFLGIGAMASMHAPPAFGVYLVWLLFWAALMLLLLMWSVFGAVMRARRKHREVFECDSKAG